MQWVAGGSGSTAKKSGHTDRRCLLLEQAVGQHAVKRKPKAPHNVLFTLSVSLFDSY